MAINHRGVPFIAISFFFSWIETSGCLYVYVPMVTGDGGSVAWGKGGFLILRMSCI
ncbi:hypothetical protein Pro02_77540 [Planobispora rosea]|uniref:Uncharacterized protein n=1 Tax=Planobispora rosea TaxID=35762 RepID=A0A8J3SB51_PLARO|nr:hypothetical protein Pro02_77540 [Planobispora rosea]